MAYFSKLWGLCRTSMAQPVTIGGQAAEQPMSKPVEFCKRLFVRSLSFDVDDKLLRDAFSPFGKIIDAKVITDIQSGRSRGFGFVEFKSDEFAKAALSSMDGQFLKGRNIHVSYATDSKQGYGSTGSYRDLKALASTFEVKSKLGLKMKQ